MESSHFSASAVFLGYSASSLAMILGVIGACLGIDGNAVAIASIAGSKPHLVIKSILPMIMAGMVAVYGLITAMIIANGLSASTYLEYSGSVDWGAALCTGIPAIGCGVGLGMVGKHGIQRYAANPQLFTALLVQSVMCEAVAVFGLIVSIMLEISKP